MTSATARVVPGPTGIQTEIVAVTPAMAAGLLSRNTMNRSISDGRVDLMADDMTAGRWMLNGDPIRIARDGTLMDGQHRLSAVIKSGRAIQMLIISGLDKQVFATIDAGRIRTAGDILAIAGVHYYPIVASAARVAATFKDGRTLHGGAISRKEVTDFALAHPYLADVAHKVRNRLGYLNAGPLTGVLFLANEKRLFDEDIDVFLEGLGTGEGLERGDPRLTLREWAMKERMRGRGQLTARAVVAASARCWTAFVRREKLRVLKISSKPVSADTVEIVGFNPPKPKAA